jgi:SAM-dependent methyltransferase
MAGLISASPASRTPWLVVAAIAATSCNRIPGREVRYEPTPMPVVRAMLQLAQVGPNDVVYDLGSGDGRIPIAAAQEFGARGVGIEIDPALVERARANAAAASVSDRVEFRLGNMYDADLGGATIVTLFLHPEPNMKLRPKLRSELPPGARIVSYVWDLGDWKPDEVKRINRRTIRLWRVRAGSPLKGLTTNERRAGRP